MNFLRRLIQSLSRMNDFILALSRILGVATVALMVVVALTQVFCRYFLGNALSWPDEAARFCMLWMTGLMAPIAFRSGGFVAIDVVPELLPKVAARILNQVLLALTLAVLYFSVQIVWAEVTGIGGRFASASLYLPTSFDFSHWYRVPRSWMMASLLVGMVMLFIVNIELLLRNTALLLGMKDIPEMSTAHTEGAE
ncbi:TRAP transporter small permease [Falsirhodobacter sp. alg1]|uniref:TRAP transporter small permease n=1 Tax=Falsirhodobacter sp. alg1 TaxID=1472418 RepID=UPI0005F08996|nr:TRAP transporter small permease subunit [Falsirhodobacter sp. alg1]